MKLHESIDTLDKIYLVLEYLEGTSLAITLQNEPTHCLAHDLCLKVLKQLILAIELLHSLNISHRDIKLDNIILNGDKIRLIDFGFAVVSNRPLKLSCGSLMFMAPELFDRGKEYMGPPCDIWSAGVVFYAISTGHFPFAAHTERDIINKIRKGIYHIPQNYPKKFHQIL